MDRWKYGSGYGTLHLLIDSQGGLFDLNAFYSLRCGTQQVRFDEFGQHPIWWDLLINWVSIDITLSVLNSQWRCPKWAPMCHSSGLRIFRSVYLTVNKCVSLLDCEYLTTERRNSELNNVHHCSGFTVRMWINSIHPSSIENPSSRYIHFPGPL